MVVHHGNAIVALALSLRQVQNELVFIHGSPMPRTTAAHATEMRQRILDRYFESKEELYLAMCESVTRAQLDDLAVQLADIADPRERLASAVDLFVQGLDVEHWGAIV